MEANREELEQLKVREYVSKYSNNLNSQKPAPQHWTNFTIGRSYFHISALVNTWEKKIGVALMLTGPDAKAYFHLLNNEHDVIEQEFGEQLDWRENPGKKESGIWLRTDRDPSKLGDWQSQHGWLLEKLEKFHSVFAMRIKSLDADQYEPDTAE